MPLIYADAMENAMAIAITLAKKAAENGEVPVGAVITETATGRIIAQACNQMRAQKDPCAHAEMLAIREASRLLNQERLSGYSLTVTLEPCVMCAGAIAHARLDRLVFGAYDPKSGGVEHGPCVFTQLTTHHKPEIIGGVDEAVNAKILSDFFAKRR